MTSIAGCWGERETEELGIVTAVGLDTISEDKVLVSIEVLNPAALARGVGTVATQTKIVAWVLREEASTIINALSNIQRRSPRVLFVGQVHTVIVGQNLAREGISTHLEWFAREGRVRRTTFVATCDSASGLLQRPFMEDLPALTLVRLAVNAPLSGETTAVTINDFLRNLSQPGIEPITIHTAGRETQDLQVKRQGEDVEQVNPSVKRPLPLESGVNIPGELPQDSPVLDPIKEAGTAEQISSLTISLGIAAFKGDRMVGFLDGRDARGYLWVMGKVGRGTVLEIARPDGDGEVLGINVTSARSSVTPDMSQGTRMIKVEVNLKAEAAGLPRDLILTEPGMIKRIEEAVNELVQEEIRHTLNIVQKDFQSDIYGFGKVLRQRNPAAWRAVADGWNEQTFPDIDVQVTVRSIIRTAGLVLRRTRH